MSEQMTDTTRPIIIYAFEPNGPNCVGGHEWRFIEEPAVLSEFLDWVSGEMRKQAFDSPENGGLHNRNYVMYGLVDPGLENEEVGEILDAESPWLDVGNRKAIYRVLSREPGRGC